MARARRLPIPAGAAVVAMDFTVPDLPTVLHLGMAQVGPSWRQAPHRHDFHELGFIRRGQGTIEQDGARASVAAASMYWLPPGQAHGGITDELDPLQILYLSLRLPPRLAAALDRRLGLGPLPQQPRFAPLRHALFRLNEALVARWPEGALAARVLAVLAHLAELADEPARASATPRQRSLAETALRRLETCAAAPPSLATLARSLSIGADHLGQALHAHTGTTWPRLIAAARLRLAQQLLADGRRPIREVARVMGLSGERALARLIRRETGRSPSDLRSE